MPFNTLTSAFSYQSKSLGFESYKGHYNDEGRGGEWGLI